MAPSAAHVASAPAPAASTSPAAPAADSGGGGGADGFFHRMFVPVASGSVAGGIEICVTYPLEFAKNSIQVQPGRFRSLFHAVRYNVAKDGIAVLYRGLPSWLLFAFPRNAVRFTVFENTIGCFDNRSLPHVQMLSGMVAGAIEAPLCLVPMQNVSIKMTHDANRPPAEQRFPRFFPGLALIAKEEGLAGLMLKGLWPTLAKNVINYSIRFPVYLNARKAAVAHTARRDGVDPADVTLHFGESWACGAVAGGSSALFSHPADVVKAQMMSLDAHKFGGSNLACLRHVWATGGLRGLYAGLTPRLTRVCMEMGLLFSIYDHVAAAIKELVAKRGW